MVAADLFGGSLGLLEQNYTGQLDLGQGAASLQPGWISSRPVGVWWASEASSYAFPGENSSCSSVSICFPSSMLITFANLSWLDWSEVSPAAEHRTEWLPIFQEYMCFGDDLGIVANSPSGWATVVLRRTNNRVLQVSCVFLSQKIFEYSLVGK